MVLVLAMLSWECHGIIQYYRECFKRVIFDWEETRVHWQGIPQCFYSQRKFWFCGIAQYGQTVSHIILTIVKSMMVACSFESWSKLEIRWFLYFWNKHHWSESFGCTALNAADDNQQYLCPEKWRFPRRTNLYRIQFSLILGYERSASSTNFC